MDNDFFAAPPPAQPAWSYPQPTVQPPAQRQNQQRNWHLGAILVAVVALAATGVTVAAGSLLTKHDTKALDSRSLAYDATTKSDLTQVALQERAYFAEKGQYSNAQEIGASVLPGPSGTQVTVMYDDSSFCLQGAHLGTKNVYYYSSAGGLLPLGQTCS